MFSVLDSENTMNAIKIGIVTAVIIGIIIFIAFTLVAVTNIENNQTLSERTSAEIYQDLLDSKAREKIIFTQAIDYKIHGESEINKAIEELEDEIKLRLQLFDEYSNLPIEMQTEPGLDNEIFRMEKYDIILQGNDIEILEAQKEIERNFRITMERNGCDTCPIYSVSITGDGSVLYKGLQNVKEMGKKEYSIPIDDVTELIRFFYTQDEGTLKTLYGSPESDDSVILTIELGNTIRITHYGDAGPEFLKLLEDKIDETAKTEQFLNNLVIVEQNKQAPVYELIDTFKEKYSNYEITEYPDSKGIPWKYSVTTSSSDVELIFGEERTILRSYGDPDGDLICTVINPFPKDIMDSCPPKW